jgi:hypothetical protein
MKVAVFDAQNRALVQTVTQRKGLNETTLTQRLEYDAAGRVSAIDTTVHEGGLNGSGGLLDHSYQQRQTYSYDGAGRVSREETKTWGDTASPLKTSVTTVDNIQYAKGERVSWRETTESSDKTTVDVKEMNHVTYDGLGRVMKFDGATWEKDGARMRLLYTDKGAMNLYDGQGRALKTITTRAWGTAAAQGAPALQSGYELSTGGESGVAGLSDGWTSGSAAVVIDYEYATGGTAISGQWVRAQGTGVHKDGEVTAAGIHLTYHQSAIQYDSVGRITSYHQSVTQVEKYDYVKQVQKGLKRKNAKKSATEAVTTESDVQVRQPDRCRTAQGHTAGSAARWQLQ